MHHLYNILKTLIFSHLYLYFHIIYIFFFFKPQQFIFSSRIISVVLYIVSIADYFKSFIQKKYLLTYLLHGAESFLRT